ncbi:MULTISPECIES: PD-(D/E)XK nuclease family protein [Trichocoleus]|uniref:PD-(D/E)XK nuclease family protein n=1 Tax=Trichocoleus desertorum GB2-A4 TaxID=2933944 RepID=A0ABV0J7V9_9CYAN|nr:PD-(D/E)XK nuclease family protein [Trichocoleus sp. FACHB-46]MBD1862220.1 PD-(D/E)XK nuclease family protein [Trichocoleus sp. FACHB-46]
MSLESQRLPHYTAKTVRENGKQYYVNAQGRRLPSVTTILNATKPQAHREALANWRDRVGAAEATRISGAASRRGTGTHKQIQRYLSGEAVVCSETVQPYWDSVAPVLQEIHQIRLVEGFVFHEDLGYAGQVDCVASYQGVPCVCEWKTADKPKQTIERLYDYPLQLVAYLGAANQLYQDHELNLAHGLLVVALPGLAAELFWFDSEALSAYWQEWEARVAEFWRRARYWRKGEG